MRGGYERAERKLLARLIAPGDAVIELGASLGIVTSLLARKVGAGGKVAAVEPNRLLHRHFEKQLAVNGETAVLVPVLGCPLWRRSIASGSLQWRIRCPAAPPEPPVMRCRG